MSDLYVEIDESSIRDLPGVSIVGYLAARKSDGNFKVAGRNSLTKDKTRARIYKTEAAAKTAFRTRTYNRDYYRDYQRLGNKAQYYFCNDEEVTLIPIYA